MEGGGTVVASAEFKINKCQRQKLSQVRNKSLYTFWAALNTLLFQHGSKRACLQSKGNLSLPPNSVIWRLYNKAEFAATV